MEGTFVAPRTWRLRPNSRSWLVCHRQIYIETPSRDRAVAQLWHFYARPIDWRLPSGTSPVTWRLPPVLYRCIVSCREYWSYKFLVGLPSVLSSAFIHFIVIFIRPTGQRLTKAFAHPTTDKPTTLLWSLSMWVSDELRAPKLSLSALAKQMEQETSHLASSNSQGSLCH